MSKMSAFNHSVYLSMQGADALQPVRYVTIHSCYRRNALGFYWFSFFLSHLYSVVAQDWLSFNNTNKCEGNCIADCLSGRSYLGQKRWLVVIHDSSSGVVNRNTDARPWLRSVSSRERYNRSHWSEKRRFSKSVFYLLLPVPTLSDGFRTSWRRLRCIFSFCVHFFFPTQVVSSGRGTRAWWKYRAQKRKRRKNLTAADPSHPTEKKKNTTIQSRKRRDVNTHA